ncbi:MAG: nitroreductase family protein [bacterium]
MEFYEVIQKRRSVRSYADLPVSEEAITRILEAARQAPSACNRQPWHLYVIRDEAARKALFQPEKQEWAGRAPVAIVACSRPGEAWVRWADKKNHADVDLAILFEHLVLAATAEGLGTCWICAFDPKHVREVLRLPAELEPVAMTPIGYPAGASQPTSRKPLDAIVTRL